MNEKKTNWPLIVGGGVLVGLLLVACLGLAWWGTAWLWGRGTALPQYRSNGAQIYFTATSQRGTPISSELGMGMGMGGMMACVTCHGSNGQGGRVRMMMRTFEAPDIRYKILTSAQPGQEHEPYTDETIKRAITQAVDPAGKPLDWPMPRWTMSAADLDDLLAFLKTLD